MANTKIDFLYLNQDDMVKAGVTDMHRCIGVMEEMFELLGKGDYLMGGPNRNSHGIEITPPLTSPFPNMPVASADRRFMAMPAYLGGRFNMAGCKWYGSNRENIKKGLPRSILMVTLNDPDTGAPVAYMSGNLISSMRTGAVPGVGVKYLANPDSEVVGVIGCGVINRACVTAIKDACPNLKLAKIYDVIPQSAENMSKYIQKVFPDMKTVITKSIEETVRDADIITSATSGSAKPFIDDHWLKPGVLLSLPAEMEVPKEFILKARKIIDNKKMHMLWHDYKKVQGNFHELVGIISSYMMEYIDEGLMTWGDVTNIGDIIAGKVPGRQSHDEQIIFAMGGMPVSDVAWGTEIYHNAAKMGIGTKLNLWDTPYKL